MSQIVRHKGGWINKKKLEKRKEMSRKMVEAKRKKKEAQNVAVNDCAPTKSEEENKLGVAVVDLDEFRKKSWCANCKSCLSMTQIVSQRREGLHVILNIECMKCKCVSAVPLGKTHFGADGKELSDLNSSIVLGAVNGGNGLSAINSILACLEIDVISPNLFKKYEREVGKAIEQVAKTSCKLAAEEERRLVVENVEKLRKEL